MRCRNRLDVARLRNGDDELIVGDEIFQRQFALVGDDPGAAGLGELPLHLEQIGLDDGAAPGRVGEYRIQLGDQLTQFRQLLAQLVGLECGQPA